MSSRSLRAVVAFVSSLLGGLAAAQGGDLSYPQPPLTALQIVEQADLAARGRLVRNAVSERQGKEAALVINRATPSRRERGDRPSVQTFESFVNSRPANPAIESQQLAVLTSGKARGTAILFTNYTDADKSSKIMLWLPTLRKVRRIAEPRHDDYWFGTNLTYGELVLRRPHHQEHELLGEGVLEGCLRVMQLEDWERGRATRSLPPPQCGHEGRPVYRIKSTTRFRDWWYDHHVSEIDVHSFAVYRSTYFKDGEAIKTVDVDWQPLGLADPRVIYPRYVYAHTLNDGRESLVYIPRSTIRLDTDLPDGFWSEKTLRRSRR